MLKTLITSMTVFSMCGILSAASPDDYMKTQQIVFDKRISNAQKEMNDARKTRKKEIKDATNEYIEAIRKVKVYWTKKGDYKKALVYKKELEEFQNSKGIATSSKPDNSYETVSKINEITKKLNSIDEEPKTTVTIPTTGGTATSGNCLKLDEVFQALCLKDHGFSLNGSSIDGAIEHTKLNNHICTNNYTFNGKCEYSLKVQARWYHSAILMIDGKEYSISMGHWANNGARILVAGEEIKLKGKPYKTDKMASEKWAEVKIIVNGNKVSYIYNGTQIHEATANIPKNSTLQFGFSPYRCKIKVRDFCLKL